jgi:uncharacterized protein (TIGR02453 family)
MKKTPAPTFSRDTIKFLERAARQKNPNWLDKNRADYETLILEPLKYLATHLKAQIMPEAPSYHFPLKGIGRMRRPAHRVNSTDPESSRASQLYRNWLGYTATRPPESRFERNPSLFFMINSEDKEDTVLVAGGLYMPSSRQVKALRQAIAEDEYFAEALATLFKSKAFSQSFKGGFSSERTSSRVPRGFDPLHPRMEWIKLQAFFVWRSYSLREFASKDFFKLVERDWKQALRLNLL